MTRQLVTYAEILDGAKVEPLANWGSWQQVSAQPLDHHGVPLGYVIIFLSAPPELPAVSSGNVLGAAVPMYAGFNVDGVLCSPSIRNTLVRAAEDIGDAIMAAAMLQADDPIDTPQPPVITELGDGMRIVDDVIVGYPTAEPVDDTAKSPCLFCGRPTNGTLLARMVDGGGALALHHDDECWDGDEGDMAYFPVGPDCAKPLPPSALATGDRLTD